MYWDSKNQKQVRRPDRPVENHPGWIWRDCDCCNGIQWSAGYVPNECDCNMGWYCKHLKSGVLAIYPGGPFLGREKPEEPS